jgi:hypothetical protein
LLSSVSSELLEAESLYNAASYSDALSLLNSIFNEAASLPSLIADELPKSIQSYSSDSSSQASSSELTMLEDSETKLISAKESYDSAASSLISKEVEDARQKYTDGHSLASEAFDLIERSKNQEILSNEIKMALIFGPLALIIILLIYFKLQFKKVILKSTISKNKIKKGSKLEIQRTIVFNNIEKVPVPVRITDSPPMELNASEFSMDPSSTEGTELVWLFQAEPGKTSLYYKLSSEALQNTIKVPAATISYEADGVQKKYIGQSSEIKII